MSRKHAKLSAARLSTASTTIAVLLSTSAAHAALLAYEPFQFGDVAIPAAGQYAPGNENAGTKLLGGQNTVIGPTAFYAGPWIQSGADSQAIKPLPSLSFPGLVPGIGGIQQETIQFDCCTFGRSGRALAQPLGQGLAQKNIYESFLIDFGTQGADAAADFGLHAHELWNGGIGESFLAVDLFLNSFSATNELTLKVTTAGNGTTSVPVNGGGLNLNALAGTHLVVMKYSFKPAAPDVVSVFLDPVPGAPEPPASAQIAVATSDLEITHQGAFTQFTFSGSGHIPGAIDEIRWGDTFTDVTPALTLTGDLNADGFVGVADLNIVLSKWNQNVAAGNKLLGDPSGDGFVGIQDLNTVLGNWNAGTPPASPLPEPATAAVLALCSPALLRRRAV